jgi:membrane protease YdiL (CAAX protease family)
MFLLPGITGIPVEQIKGITVSSPVAVVKAFLLMQGMTNFFVFALSAFIFAYLSHPEPAKYLGLRAPGKPIQWVLTVIVILGAMPLVMGLQQLISLIDFRPDIKAAQKLNDDTMEAVLNMPDFKSFLAVFTAVAIIPALGEELFFRGVLMRFAKKKSTSMVMPVIFTAAVFAYTHTNIYGLASIFLAGVLLAAIYYLTGSLWCSILAHMCFNGLQIVLCYLGNGNSTIKAFASSGSVPVSFIIAGAVVFSASFYLLLKNKTPLPPNWSDDFTREELAEVIIDKYI